MLHASIALIFGIAALVWSAGRFVDGASGLATRLGMPPLLVGMIVVGFGTSMPELMVSAIASFNGSSGIALGNAFGSNIANIALILGVSGLVSPVFVARSTLMRELPILSAITVLALWLMRDNHVSRIDALVFLAVFAVWLCNDIIRAMRRRTGNLAKAVESPAKPMSLGKALIWLAVGLAGLAISSRAIVWGAVEYAEFFGVSDLMIGLTVIAVGTSLPELASSVVAARRGEHELALGNVIGSNIFNTLAVVGLAGAIKPISADPLVFRRDIPISLALTLALFVLGFNYRKTGDGRIGRMAASLLLAAYVAYTVILIRTSAA